MKCSMFSVLQYFQILWTIIELDTIFMMNVHSSDGIDTMLRDSDESVNCDAVFFVIEAVPPNGISTSPDRVWNWPLYLCSSHRLYAITSLDIVFLHPAMDGSLTGVQTVCNLSL